MGLNEPDYFRTRRKQVDLKQVIAMIDIAISKQVE
jgi:hypothetical protein